MTHDSFDRIAATKKVTRSTVCYDVKYEKKLSMQKQRLYGATGAGSVAPQAMLTHVGADFDMIFIDFDKKEHTAPEFLAINPRGQVPALVLSDGSILSESAAIMLHIADTHPQSGLIADVGTPARAQTYRWMSFIATNVYEGVLHYMYPDHYTTDSNHAGVTTSADQSQMRSWGLLNDALSRGPVLVGDKAGVADIYLAMLFFWHHDMDRLHAEFSNLRGAIDNTLKLASVEDVFKVNELL